MNLGGFQACLRVPFDNCQTTFECLVLGRNHPGFRLVGHFPMSVLFVFACFVGDGGDCAGGKKGFVLYVGGSPLGPAWRGGMSQKRGRGESCERTSGIFSIRLNDGIRIVWFVEWDCIWWGVALCHEE